MNQNKEGPSSYDANQKFHIVQSHRDLESNWVVDLAKNLEDYLLKICSREITSEDDSQLCEFRRSCFAASEINSSFFGRESLRSDAVDKKKDSARQAWIAKAGAPDECGASAAPNEEDDPFWGLDDIPVEAKNTLDSATFGDATLDYFVKPPTDLVLLEGDYLDGSGDCGELESYLLPLC